MRAVREWDISDLDALCRSKAQEDLNLEFKSSPSLGNTQGKKEEMCKDVSAMANAAGGIIVYGIVENDLGEADLVDDGCDLPFIKSEWIDQVLNSGVEPKISGVFIQTITLSNGNRAFAIEIPQATALAPHQARGQKRYYKRNGRIVDSMYDYEIKDLMRRGNTPSLFIKLEVRQSNGEYFLRCSVGNNSSEPALYSVATFLFHDKLDIKIPDMEELPNNVFLEVGGTRYLSKIHIKKMGVPGYFPIFKETEWVLFDVKLTIDHNSFHPFYYSIQCPGFKDAQGGYIRCVNGVISLHLS